MQGYLPQGGAGYGHHGGGFAPPGAPQGVGQLELYSSFFPLMWFLFFTSLRVTINGHEQLCKWGPVRFDLPAGVHHVKCHFPNLFFSGGVAETQFQIWPGHTTRVNYEAPFLFAALAGTITVAGAEPIAQLPPAGYG